MPSRILREGILTSDRVNALTVPAEVFYRRLMSVVDDFGRFDARPVMLKVSCFPLRVDVVREADISRWIAECEKAGLLVLYAVLEKPYLQLLDFRQAARAKQSKFPAAPDGMRSTCHADAMQMRSTCDASAPEYRISKSDAESKTDSGFEVEVEFEEKHRTKGRRPKQTPIADDFGISDRVKAWALAKGYGHLAEHLEHFVSKARAKGYAYADWDEAFMEAIRKNWAGVNVPTSKAPADHGTVV